MDSKDVSREAACMAKTVNERAADSGLEQEIIAGQMFYLDVLKAMHNRLNPRLYLEIGVRHGHSLNLATCESIAIDPDCATGCKISENVALYEMTSDDFFQKMAHSVIRRNIDFAFIDGMHLFEYVLRDFINVEKYCDENSVIVIDDIFPNHPAQAKRFRETRVWMGDVWKIIECVKRYRPELKLDCLDSSPSGLLVVSGFGRGSLALQQQYDCIVEEFSGEQYQTPPEPIISRRGSLSPLGYLTGMAGVVI